MENKIFNEQNVSKAYFKLTIPLVFSMLITLIYNLADTFFVAQTNDTALVAGVSLGMPIFTSFMAIGNIFGQGGSSLISRMLGKKEYDNAKKVSSFCFYMTIFIGVIFTIFMLVFKSYIVNLIGATPETFFHANNYYKYLAIGAPAIMLSFIHSNLLRSEGMSKESMLGTIIGALVNIILDPIFISILGFGASGAAVATVLGYVVSDIYFVIIVIKKSKFLSVDIFKMKIPFNYINQILTVGIPAAIVNLMESLSVVLMNHFLIPYGNDKIAAMGIVLKISMIALLLLTGLAFGGQPLFGYYYGANDKLRFRNLFKFCMKFIGLISIILSFTIYILSSNLIRIFIDNDSIIKDGTVMLKLQMITMLFVGMILLITIMFQSTGKALGSFILSISRQGILYLAILILSYNLYGYIGIIASQAISDSITMLIAAYLFYKQLYIEIKD